jgi:hypothetical protein
MRLGLLGPARNHAEALERAARFLLQEIHVDRAVYLDVDGLLDGVVRRWAERLVAGDPAEGAIWQRATDRCLQAPARAIDEFVAAERERRALVALESLPGDTARSIEILDGRVAVLLYDQDDLDEEDLLPASFLVFGASAQPVLKPVGNRWFLSPGTLEHFGVMLLEEQDDGVHLTLYDSECRAIRKQPLGCRPRSPEVRAMREPRA